MTRDDEVRGRLQELGFSGSLWDGLSDGSGPDSTVLKPRRLDLLRENIKPRLFDYQEDLVGQLLSEVGSGKRLLLSLPTGAGKTRTGMAAVLRMFERDPESRCVWLAPSVELVEQAAKTFQDLWAVSLESPDCQLAVRTPSPGDANFWIQTPQFIAQKKNIRESLSVAIFDEAHQLGAPTFRTALAHVSRQATLEVGLTATPGRSSKDETRQLVDFFGGNLLTSQALGDNPVLALQERGVLAKLVFKDASRTFAAERSLDRAKITLELSRRLMNKGRKVLVFTESVVDAKAFASILISEGYPATFVEGELPEGERSERIADFADGRSSLIFNQRLLATGYDCPAVSDVVLGSRVGSPVLFEQMVGRAARGPLTGGSPVARIWDFDDHLSIHGLPQSYYRFRDFEWQQA